MLGFLSIVAIGVVFFCVPDRWTQRASLLLSKTFFYALMVNPLWLAAYGFFIRLKWDTYERSCYVNTVITLYVFAGIMFLLLRACDPADER